MDGMALRRMRTAVILLSLMLMTGCDASLGSGGALSASDPAFLNSVRFSAGGARDDLVTDADQVVVTDGDFPDRLYQRLGELRVRIYPESADEAKSEARADDELRSEAASLGADAVIHVRYGNRTATFFRGASLDATGTAIRFWRTPDRTD